MHLLIIGKLIGLAFKGLAGVLKGTAWIVK